MTGSREVSEDQPSGRSRKRGAILAVARDLFLRNGYLAVSMDEIVARAGISKQTLYKQVQDKSSLFIEVMLQEMRAADTSVAPLAVAVAESDDLERDLMAFARGYITSVLTPDLMRLRRVAIAEAERFPALARAWYDAGPQQAYETFADWFARLHERGLLNAPDPVLAAQHFNWLVLSIPLNEAMSRPIPDQAPTSRRLHRYADEGVRVFLAAYGRPPGATFDTPG